MAKTRKPAAASNNGLAAAGADSAASSYSTPSTTSKPLKQKTSKPQDPSTSSLTLSRNKHWRYISAFHGPWLQLPHEILESLAHGNYFSPRPYQTNPGVLYDLLKIRKLVDDAADLAVRAQNGTASSALANADNGLPGRALGLSCRGAGGNAKLSPERKYRMRELATQKLAQAYGLDEVAASVASMQSASTLDNVAGLVLQRSPGNADAKYVQFFHEKIPARMVAECTPLGPLNEIIAATPGHAAPFRTRALTKIFKEDYIGAIQDLTEALALCRLEQAKHRSTRNQLVPMKLARQEAEKRKLCTRDWMRENKVAEEDQPKGMELQLLFQRGNQYLTIACRNTRTALEHFRLATAEQREANGASGTHSESVSFGSAAGEKSAAYQRALEAREVVRKNAKRALRDYTTFFSQLEYAHAPTYQESEGPLNRDSISERLDDIENPSCNFPPSNRLSTPGSSSALVAHPQSHQRREPLPNNRQSQWSSSVSDPIVHEISALLSPSPPPGLPPFPPSKFGSLVNASSCTEQRCVTPEHDEMITYHPLIPEMLHALLLAHCLLQTPPTALLRHANNVARLVRLTNGYPFFVSARSPARVDWAEILRKTNNWIGLGDTWESLCKPPTPPEETHSTTTQHHGHKTPAIRDGRPDACEKKIKTRPQSPTAQKTSLQKRDRIHKEAVMEALGDERVVDDDTFQRTVEAREKRALHDENQDKTPQIGMNGKSKANGSNSGEPIGRGKGPISVAKDEEYFIGTERAEAVAKWITEAPTVVDCKPNKAKKKPSKKMMNGDLAGRAGADAVQMENGVGDLHN